MRPQLNSRKAPHLKTSAYGREGGQGRFEEVSWQGSGKESSARRSRALALARSAELRGDLVRAAAALRGGRARHDERGARPQGAPRRSRCSRPPGQRAGDRVATPAAAGGGRGPRGARRLRAGRGGLRAGERRRGQAAPSPAPARSNGSISCWRRSNAGSRGPLASASSTTSSRSSRRPAVGARRSRSRRSRPTRTCALAGKRCSPALCEPRWCPSRCAVTRCRSPSATAWWWAALRTATRATRRSAVPSMTLSRCHLAIERGRRRAAVRDLGSRHGTTRGAVRSAASARRRGAHCGSVGTSPCVVRPAAEWPGAVAVEVAGARTVAPLGPAALGVGRWTLARTEVGWVELVTDDAPPRLCGRLRLAPRVTLLAGDALGDASSAASRAVVFGEPVRAYARRAGVSDAIEHLLRAGATGGPSHRGGAPPLRARPRDARGRPRYPRGCSRATRSRRCPSRCSWPSRRRSSTAASARRRCRPSRAPVAAGADAPRRPPRARRATSPGALALVEHVLLRDFDWPGARERHARWRGRSVRTLDVPRRPRLRRAPATWLSPAGARPSGCCARRPAAAPATVYEAEDRELRRRVALKVYHRPERDRAQLLHEARVAVALAGEGVVPVFDVDPRARLARDAVGARSARCGARLREPRTPAALGPDRRWARAAFARALARVHAGGLGAPRRQAGERPPARAATRRMLGGLRHGPAPRGAEPAGSLGYVSPERLAGRAERSARRRLRLRPDPRGCLEDARAPS